MKHQEFAGSALVAEWDTDTRLFRRWNPAGVLQESRAFTAQEDTEADRAIAAAAATANEISLSTSLGGSDLFDNLRTVAQGTGAFATSTIRDAAIRTCARALVVLIRLNLRRFDATD